MAQKANKGNLKVVDAEYQQKRLAACEKHRTRQEKARSSHRECRAILAEYLDTLDDATMYLFIGLPALMGRATAIDAPDGEIIEWADRLDPEHALTSQRVEQIVKQFAEKDEVLTDPDLCDIDDECSVLRSYLADTVFILGIIAGAKMAGYSKEKLEKIADAAADAIS